MWVDRGRRGMGTRMASWQKGSGSGQMHARHVEARDQVVRGRVRVG